MRRVLLFLLIFGAGFAVLWTLRTKPSKSDRRAEPEAPRQPGQFTEVETPTAKSGRQKIGVTFGGRVEFTQSKEVNGVMHPEIELVSKEVDPVGEDMYDMHELEVRLLDPETQKLRAELRSPSSRVKLAIDTNNQPRLSETEPVQLTNVDLTLHEGGPIVPLHLKVPRLDWTIGPQTFASNDRVQINGTGLEATGTGLLARLGESSLELKQDAKVVFDLDNGQQVTLESGLTGPIVFAKLVVDGVEHVDVTASEGARFLVSGTDAVAIRARTIHMIGRRATTGYAIVSADANGAVHATSRGDTFDAETAKFTFSNDAMLQEATLDEHVVLTRRPDTFRADHAKFEFEATGAGHRGELTKATLTGSPTGTIEVGRFLPPENEKLRDALGHLSGNGPLVVTRKDGDQVVLTGPAKLEIPDVELTLTATKSISGHDDPKTKSGTLTADGDSVLVYGPNSLRSDALDLAWVTDEAGNTKLDAKSRGVSRVEGVTETGQKMTMVARGGLEATSTKDKITVTEARDVVVTSPERGGSTAGAEVIHDFELATRSFSAQGNVTFSSADGEGTAGRIVTKGRDEAHLYGTPTAPARFKFLPPDAEPGSEAEISGTEIVVVPGQATASGSVHARVQNSANRLDLTCTDLDIRLPRPDSGTEKRTFHVHATGDVKSHWSNSVLDVSNVVAPGGQLVESKADVDCQDLVVDGTVTPKTGAGGKATVTTTNVVARTAVHVDYKGTGDLTGDGDLFTLDENGRGRLQADPGKQVRARGRFVGTPMPYGLEADWIEFDAEHVEASKVRVRLDEKGNPIDAAAAPSAEETSAQKTSAQMPEQGGPGAAPAMLRELHADKIRADKKEILLEGSAHIEGVTGQDEAWSVDAGSIRMNGDFSNARVVRTDQITSLQARGGFHAQLGDRLEAQGESLDGTPKKLRIEGTPARLLMLDAEWQSPWIEYDTDNMLLSTDTGSLRSRVGSPGPSWSLEYESMQPFDRGDTTILVLRNPRLRAGARQLFAEWMLFWVDRNEWRKSGRRTIGETMHGTELKVSEPGQTAPAPRTGRPMREQQNPLNLPGLLLDIQSSPVLRVLSEVYIEGNIETFEQGKRQARASAIYLDIIETQGWIQDADVGVDIDVRGFRQRLRARAQWMRISPEPALRAEKAEITACDFDDPHYVIETSDLRIRPKSNVTDQRVAYDVSARGNSIRFENGFKLPLPPLVYETDEQGNPLIDRFVLGNSAKYGAAVSATVNQELGPVGKATGRALAKVLRFPETDIRGNWHYKVGILGSRGLLFGPGLELRAGNVFKLEMEYDVIPDRKSDKGLVRVERDDRSLLRTWFHARARYTVADGEWFDLAVSTQSDAGVQSEFFERDFLRYEEKDTYLHWRKAHEEWYFNASAKVRLDDRRDVEELPSAGAYLGRSRIGELYDNPLYYTGRVDAGYLRRHDGDPRYYVPFEDGLGDRELLRLDTEHRVEMPFSLGVLGARGTPYLSARSTIWSEGADPDSSPYRAALIAGFETSTTFWKRYSSGGIHTLTPSLGVRTDIVSQESGGDPVHIDTTDDPFTGRFVEAGLRSRWWMPDTPKHLDIDVRVSHGTDVAEGEPSGLQPIAVLGEFLTYVKSIPVAMTHDGRYDVSDGKTVYSLTSFGFEPWPNLGLEFGHQRGLSTDEERRLFESASIGTRWRVSPKWEIEAGQSYAIAGDTGVGNELTLRRLGHDFVTEIQFGYRQGEGSTFSIGFEPRISYSRSGLGLLDHLLGLYH